MKYVVRKPVPRPTTEEKLDALIDAVQRIGQQQKSIFLGEKFTEVVRKESNYAQRVAAEKPIVKDDGGGLVQGT